MTDEGSSLTAAGGWCAPSTTVYDTGPDLIALPSITVPRGGVLFPQPGTPEWEAAEARRRADAAVAALVARRVGDVLAAQDHAVRAALRDAERAGLLVHVTPAPWGAQNEWRWGLYRFVSIELREPERPTQPTSVHWHPQPRGYYGPDDDDDWSDDD